MDPTPQRARECVFCGTRDAQFGPFGLDLPVFTEFDVVGGGCRPAAQCPACWSFDRERLVYLYLMHRTDLLRCAPGTKSVLHMAPEARVWPRLKDAVGPGYVAGDLSPTGDQRRLDVTALPFEDGTFDAVICNHVLEHVPDDAKAMSELRRVLKPGGWAMLQVPLAMALEKTREDWSVTDPAERERVFGQNDHVRLYGRDYPERLRRAGFDVELFDWTAAGEDFGGGEADNRFGLIERERLHIARSPEIRLEAPQSQAGAGAGASGEPGNDTTEVRWNGRAMRLCLPDQSDHIQNIIRRTAAFYEPGMLEDFERQSRQHGWAEPARARVAIDVGANIGNHAVFLAAVCGMNVVAIEPFGYAADVLAKNAALNGLSGKVRVVRAAAGRERGSAAVVPGPATNLGLTRAEPQTEPGPDGVPIIPLDELDLPGAVGVIKVDVEGAEVEVLMGAERLIRRDRPVVYAEVGSWAAFGRVRELMMTFGYAPTAVFNATPTVRFEPLGRGDYDDQLAAVVRHVFCPIYERGGHAPGTSAAELFEPVPAPVGQDADTYVTASLATMPSRLPSLERVVRDVLAHVNRLNVYLNGFERVPAFLVHPKIRFERSQEHGDRRDNGKFFWAAGVRRGYCFVIDDDLVYPSDFVARSIATIERYGRRAVVGVHGCVLAEPMERFFLGRRVAHVAAALPRDTLVNYVATNAAGWHTDTFTGPDRVQSGEFYVGEPGMADVWLALACRSRAIPVVALAREEGWLKTIETNGPNLWEEFREHDPVQTRHAKAAGPWGEQPVVEAKVVHRIAGGRGVEELLALRMLEATVLPGYLT